MVAEFTPVGIPIDFRVDLDSIYRITGAGEVEIDAANTDPSNPADIRHEGFIRGQGQALKHPNLSAEVLETVNNRDGLTGIHHFISRENLQFSFQTTRYDPRWDGLNNYIVTFEYTYALGAELAAWSYTSGMARGFASVSKEDLAPGGTPAYTITVDCLRAALVVVPAGYDQAVAVPINLYGTGATDYASATPHADVAHLTGVVGASPTPALVSYLNTRKRYRYLNPTGVGAVDSDALKAYDQLRKFNKMYDFTIEL